MDSSRLPVIVNRSGGTASSAGDSLGDELEEAFAAAGQAIDLKLVEGEDVAATLAPFRAAGRVAIGGGDGTIGTGAAFAAENGIELAVLPLGTRNHFARQLQVPLELREAAILASRGNSLPVDLGDCGGRTFINNASVGAYVDLVRERERSSLPKLSASIVAAVKIILHLRPRRYDLTIDGERHSVLTPMLFIGNNRYEIADGKPGERERLTDGKLSVFALAPLSLLALLALAVRTLFGRPDMRSDFVLEKLADELLLEGPGRSIEIALDGERKSFTLPVAIRIRPGALRVIASQQKSD